MSVGGPRKGTETTGKRRFAPGVEFFQSSGGQGPAGPQGPQGPQGPPGTPGGSGGGLFSPIWRGLHYQARKGDNQIIDTSFFVVGATTGSNWTGGATVQMAAAHFALDPGGSFRLDGDQNLDVIWYHIDAIVANAPKTFNYEILAVDNNFGFYHELPSANQGTVSVGAASTAVVGVGTLFNVDAVAGDLLYVVDSGEYIVIDSVTNALHLVLGHNTGNVAVSGSAYKIVKRVYQISNQAAQVPVNQAGTVTLAVVGSHRLHIFGNNDLLQSALHVYMNAFEVPGVAPGEFGGGGPGNPGADGAAGVMGPPGQEGRDGEDGWIGPPGPPGSQGATGAAGSMGPPGVDGMDGEAGNPGPPGSQGAAGAAGADGLPGALGPMGRDGEDGQDAFPIPGPQGPQGPQGIGVPGMDGEDGEAWMMPGPTGPIGPQGPAGSAGSSTGSKSLVAQDGDIKNYSGTAASAYTLSTTNSILPGNGVRMPEAGNNSVIWQWEVDRGMAGTPNVRVRVFLLRI